jgi:hypothetical protein
MVAGIAGSAPVTGIYVATVSQRAGLGTLLFDLLTEEEGRKDRDKQTGHLRINIKSCSQI